MFVRACRASKTRNARRQKAQAKPPSAIPNQLCHVSFPCPRGSCAWHVLAVGHLHPGPDTHAFIIKCAVAMRRNHRLRSYPD